MAEAKTLHIIQVRSQIGRPADQGKNPEGSGPWHNRPYG